jgi:hypothetical protein
MIFDGQCGLCIMSNTFYQTVFRRREISKDIFPNLLSDLLDHLRIS